MLGPVVADFEGAPALTKAGDCAQRVVRSFELRQDQDLVAIYLLVNRFAVERVAAK